jgi:hypothetical protein
MTQPRKNRAPEEDRLQESNERADHPTTIAPCATVWLRLVMKSSTSSSPVRHCVRVMVVRPSSRRRISAPSVVAGSSGVTTGSRAVGAACVASRRSRASRSRSTSAGTGKRR